VTRLDWDRARRPARSRREAAGRPRGISNDQARELGRLSRQAGVPYGGNGMSAQVAAATIASLRRQLSPPPR
jgi:hypothetical protein